MISNLPTAIRNLSGQWRGQAELKEISIPASASGSISPEGAQATGTKLWSENQALFYASEQLDETEPTQAAIKALQSRLYEEANLALVRANEAETMTDYYRWDGYWGQLKKCADELSTLIDQMPQAQ